jgi:hypothetical protein
MLHRLFSSIFAALTKPGRAGPELAHKLVLGAQVGMIHLVAPMIPALQSTFGKTLLVLSVGLFIVCMFSDELASMLEFETRDGARIVRAACNLGMEAVAGVVEVYQFAQWKLRNPPTSFYRRAGRWVERKPPASAILPGRSSPIALVNGPRSRRRSSKPGSRCPAPLSPALPFPPRSVSVLQTQHSLNSDALSDAPGAPEPSLSLSKGADYGT